MSVLTTTIRMEDSQFFASMNRMEAKLSGLAAGFAAINARIASSFVPVATGIGVVTAAMFGLKKSITMAAEMEQLQTSFSVLIGSADVAKQTLKDLQTFADNTTFQMPEVAGAAKQMIAFGVGAKDVVGTIQMLGDVAAGLNIPLSELTDVYGRNLVQGRLFARDIYQFQGRGIPIIAALAKQFKVAESDIMGMVEAGKVGSKEMVAAFQSLTGEGGQFHGMLMKQSRTFNGLMSTLADNIGGVFRAFGGPLIEVLKPIVDRLILKTKEMIPVAKQFGETVARIISGLQNAFKSGQFTQLVGLSLELGFAQAMNKLAAGLETTLAVAGAAFSQLFGDPNFWEGFGKAMTGIAAQFGAALLKAFEKPLAYIQAQMQQLLDWDNRKKGNTAEAEAWVEVRNEIPKRFDGRKMGSAFLAWNYPGQYVSQSGDEVMSLYHSILAKKESENGYIDLQKRVDAILANGGVQFGFTGDSALNAGGIAKGGVDMVREGLELLKTPAKDFLTTAKEVAAAYQPSALYDETKLNAIKEKLKALFPKLPPTGGDVGDAGNARNPKGFMDSMGGGDYSIIADSLQKVGGGGGFAGVSAVLAEAREQTSELKQANKTLVEMKQVLSGRYNGNDISIEILR